MLTAQADLRIVGPGVSVHLHGDGTVLTADVEGDVRAAVRAIGQVRTAVRVSRELSRLVRSAGVRIDVRVRGRRIARIG